MNLFKLFRQPYPVLDSAGTEWIVGAFVAGFLLLFQPFGIAEWQTTDKVLKVVGFGAVTSGVMLLFNEGTRQLPRYFGEDHWTVGREMTKILTMILCIAIANRLYMSWLMGWPLQGGWLLSIGMTFLIGIFPTIGVVATNYIVQLRKYEQQAAHLVVHKQPAPATPLSEPMLNQERPVLQDNGPLERQLVTLVAENEKDSLTLNRSELLAIESSDNYCTVFYLKRGDLAKELMRSSLSRLENQLGGGTPFVRCHRSFLVNLDQVERVSGNAQGYKLHLLNGQLTVPVARKYNDTLVAGLK
ncbi:LytR/AlgR family response regulator transcription factor [Fibrivirga algicola]|uniref:LytTR family transcriptional regulator n=1 Tax=Fibrivirga algicola TaxID=2950420 RepID=A0ABX0QC54_9BACT|nr:LytTR family DNA-binding domain-containing protein [Fibrivirga algicola]NID08796.1 LytTR family transcriptional regulator [Fibrivirga algicola]